jgi:hypothetical protein
LEHVILVYPGFTLFIDGFAVWIRILCGATRLPLECCFSELALQKPNLACWSSTMRTLSSHRNVTCSLFDMCFSKKWCGYKSTKYKSILNSGNDKKKHTTFIDVLHYTVTINRAVYEKRKTRIYKYNMFKILIHSL